MEIIFCRCGGVEVIFGGSAPSIPHLFFQPVPHYQFRTEIAVPQGCGGAEGGAKVLISVKDNINGASLLTNNQGNFSWTKFHIAN